MATIPSSSPFFGHIENGKIVADQNVTLPEGTKVKIEPLPAQQEIPGSKAEANHYSFLEHYKDVIGKAVDLPKDAAVQHDHYIYGTPKI